MKTELKAIMSIIRLDTRRVRSDLSKTFKIANRCCDITSEMFFFKFDEPGSIAIVTRSQHI